LPKRIHIPLGWSSTLLAGTAERLCGWEVGYLTEPHKLGEAGSIPVSRYS